MLGATETLSAAEEGLARIGRCRDVSEDRARLACYDREARALSPPRWQGRLTLITEKFTLAAPARLRFESKGVIFVLYVKDADGEVVQNLHIGGGGEDSYIIERPGTYFLQINGSESWRIWLEPESYVLAPRSQ